MLRVALRSLAIALLGLISLRAADPAGARLDVDPARSRIEFAVRATVDSFTGRLTRFEPAIEVAPDGVVTAARLRFRCADLATGKAGRDEAMHRWLQSGEHPEAEFTLTGIGPAPAPATGLVARGRFTLHGVTRDLAFPCAVDSVGAERVISGEATVDTREHGLPVVRMLGVLRVDPLVRVRFELRGRVAAGGAR